MSDLPLATQTYKPLNKTQKVSRSTVCPIHKKQTSDFLGVQEYEGKPAWKFRCPYDRATFYAKPDKSAPTTVEGVAAWILREEQKRVQKTMAKRQ